VPQVELLKYLETLKPTSPALTTDRPSVGIGLDSCVIPTRHAGISLVETTDFFYPLINDPYMMGKIACANVLSDLYAMGVVHCDNMLLLLGIARDMSSVERSVVVPMLLEGFRDLAAEAGVTINGGQTVQNPWMIVGGVATSVCHDNEIIIPDKALPGDVLVLTKPLGTQPAVNLHQWMTMKTASWELASTLVNEELVLKAYQDATISMSTLNQQAARLMHKHGAKCATDVTGFGLLGHSKNLAESQVANVDFNIHTLPVLAGLDKVCRELIERGGRNFKLLDGLASETSGGLLVCLPVSSAQAYIDDMIEGGGKAWLVGDVVEGSKTSSIAADPKIIEVTY